MNLLLACILKRRSLPAPAGALVEEYVGRCARYLSTTFRTFPDEAALMAFVEESSGRTRAVLVLTDSRGRQVSSEEMAAAVGGFQDAGSQSMVMAVGPADGWSAAALKRANMTVAFGRITLPHELAAVVLAEQVYRALTIRAGHPYHCGH